MTVILGYVLADGFFIAADSRRTDMKTFQSSTVKKISRFSTHVYGFTGGLGDYGDIAKDKLKTKITPNANIEEVAEIAKDTFKKVYEQSIIDHGNHNIPLVLGLAGRDPKSHEGTFWILNNNTNFEKPIKYNGIGNIYPSASDSKKLKIIAEEIRDLKSFSGKLQLDEWAYETIYRVSKDDKYVGFPIQIIKVTDTIIESYPVSFQNFKKDPKFLV